MIPSAAAVFGEDSESESELEEMRLRRVPPSRFSVDDEGRRTRRRVISFRRLWASFAPTRRER
jgi:hypothetical protein